MIKAIFFDNDGTLRDFTEYGVRPSVHEAIRLAQEAQIRCYIASGRHMLEIEKEYLTGGCSFSHKLQKFFAQITKTTFKKKLKKDA